MLIEKVEINGFGNLINKKFSFKNEKEKITFVIGPNEAGKSTLISALTHTLFGINTRIIPRTRYRPWDKSANFSASIFLRDNKRKRYIVERDFENHNTIIKEVVDKNKFKILFDGDANPSGRTEEPEKYREFLKNWFGFNQQEIFHQILCVKQNEMATLTDEKISRQIMRIISGPELESLQDSQARLLKVLDKIKITGIKKKPRLLEEMRNEIENKQNQLDEINQIDRQYWSLSEEKEKLENLYKEIVEELKKKSEIGKFVLEREDIISELNEINEDLSRWRSERDKRKDLQKDLNEINENLLKLNKVRELKGTHGELIYEIQDKAKNLDEEILEKERDLNNVQTELKKAEEILDKKDLITIFISGLFFIISLLSLILKNKMTLLRSLPIYIPLFFLILSLFIAFAVYYRKMIMSSTKRKDNRKYLSKIKSKLSYLRKERKEIKDKEEEMMIKSECQSLDELREKIKDLDKFIQEMEIKEGVLEQTASKELINEKISSLENQHLEKRNRLGGIEEKFPYIKSMSTDDKIDLQSKVSKLEEEKPKTFEELVNIKAELKQMEKNLKSPYDIEEELEVLKKREKNLKLDGDAVESAIEILRDSSIEFQKELAPFLSEEVTNRFKNITGGRYDKVSFDSDTLEPVIHYVLNNIDANKDALSYGTYEQLYLMVRLALAKKLTDKEYLPLLLDDPFISFDKERQKKCLDILREISKKHQVIILSADVNLPDDKDYIISLI